MNGVPMIRHGVDRYLPVVCNHWIRFKSVLYRNILVTQPTIIKGNGDYVAFWCLVLPLPCHPSPNIFV